MLRSRLRFFSSPSSSEMEARWYSSKDEGILVVVIVVMVFGGGPPSSLLLSLRFFAFPFEPEADFGLGR